MFIISKEIHIILSSPRISSHFSLHQITKKRTSEWYIRNGLWDADLLRQFQSSCMWSRTQQRLRLCVLPVFLLYVNVQHSHASEHHLSVSEQSDKACAHNTWSQGVRWGATTKHTGGLLRASGLVRFILHDSRERIQKCIQAVCVSGCNHKLSKLSLLMSQELNLSNNPE